jgi:hypothetical protein
MLARLRRAVKFGLIDRPTAKAASLVHAEDCPHRRGGACACEPAIVVTTTDGARFAVLGYLEPQP